MIKIRIKFRKYGVMRFIGHLDIMRYFQKAMRRAEIDICYSEGFSPHQIMSFAAPLGVGITSDGEYLDIEVNSTRSSEASIKALNDTMVEGVEVTEYVKLPDNAKTAMSMVAAADYDLFFKEGYEPAADVRTFVMDLKQLVYAFDVSERDGRPVFYLKVSTGSTDNLKPELVLEAMFQAMGYTYDQNAIQIHRRDVYAMDPAGDGFISLGKMGEVIG